MRDHTGTSQLRPLGSAYAVGWTAAYTALRSVAEEILFRALLLPNPHVDGKDHMQARAFALSALIPLLLFVASHAWTTQRRPGTVISDWVFLGGVAVVGVACTYAYWLSHSLVGATFVHFLSAFPPAALLRTFRTVVPPATSGYVCDCSMGPCCFYCTGI